LSDDNIVPLSGPVVNQKFNQHSVSNLWAGKLTFNVAQGTTIIGTMFADPQTNTGALSVPASTNPNTFSGRRDVGGTDYAGRANQLFGSFGILTAQYSHHVDRFNTTPNGTDVIRVTDSTPGQHLDAGGSPDLSTYTFDTTTTGKLVASITAATGTDPVQAVAIAAVP